MFRKLTTAAAAALGAGALAIGLAASAASASVVGSTDSSGQAGYQVTGAQFRYVHASIYLRSPGQYASYLSGVGGSVSLWASDGTVIQLGISNSTSPAGSVYSPGVAPFDAAHAQITTGINEFWCPAGGSCQPAADGGGFPAGDTVTLTTYYDKAAGNVDMQEFDAAGNLFKAWFHTGTTESYTRAEVTSDFGYTPWDQKSYLGAPAAQVKLARWASVGVTNYKGRRFGLTGYFATGALRLTGAGSVPEAQAGLLNATSTAFSTYLEP